MASDLESFDKEIQGLADDLLGDLKKINNLESLESFRVEVLGKKGRLTLAMKGLSKLKADERPKAGQKANVLRQELLSFLEEKKEKLQNKAIDEKIKRERIDVSLEGRPVSTVREHPVMMVQNEVVEILARCGFVPEVGPEIDHEYYNFDALNIPEAHPARSMHDTFFVGGVDNVVLRTHTSSVQIRSMMQTPPPIRIISPGRVYRSDYDATHSPMFHQVEGLLVDRDVNMGDLKGILEVLLSEFFGAGLKLRLRPSYFPFTEPSAEVDMECCFCRFKGCQVCKQSGWIEVGGCGMVDPEVFKAVGVDSNEFKGFAFGMGLDRLAMLKYGVRDLRSLFESDQRFISQFTRWRR